MRHENWKILKGWLTGAALNPKKTKFRKVLVSSWTTPLFIVACVLTEFLFLVYSWIFLLRPPPPPNNYHGQEARIAQCVYIFLRKNKKIKHIFYFLLLQPDNLLNKIKTPTCLLRSHVSNSRRSFCRARHFLTPRLKIYKGGKKRRRKKR